MAKKNTEHLNALVFIDTNILLDFYENFYYIVNKNGKK